jgi:hypothetical protein
VHHHGGVEPVEHALFKHQDLAAAVLLGGRAEYLDREAEVVRHRCEQPPGGHRGGRDDVVAAGVPDVRQRVVLGEQADDQLAAAVPGGQRGRQAADSQPHREPGCFQRGGDPGARAVLGEGHLGIGVDGVAQPHCLVADRRQVLLDGVLRVAQLASPALTGTVPAGASAPFRFERPASR